MKHQELGNFSDVLFYLEGHGITKETAKEIALRLFGWGVDAAIDRMRPSRPEVPDDVPEIEAMKHAQLSMLGDTANRKSDHKKAAAPKKAPHRIPDDYALTPELKAYAVERGFTEIEIDSMFRKFKNHFLGNGETSPRWDAKWRTWVERGVEYKMRDKLNRQAVTDGRI